MALRYPKDDISSEYYIRFQFYKYEPPYSGDVAVTFRATQNTNASVELQRSSGSQDIYLPMPADIGSQYVGQWGGQDISTATSGILGTMGQAAGFTKSGVSIDTLSNAFKNPNITAAGVAGAGIEAAFVAAKEFLNNTPLIGANLTTNNLLALGTRAILNPNTELLYNGTDLRTHGYKFKLVPNSSGEATEIKK